MSSRFTPTRKYMYIKDIVLFLHLHELSVSLNYENLIHIYLDGILKMINSAQV